MSTTGRNHDRKQRRVDSGGNPISAVSEGGLATTEDTGLVWVGFKNNFLNESAGSDELRFLDAAVTTGALGGNGPNSTGNTEPSRDYDFLSPALTVSATPSVDLGAAVGSGKHFTLMEINDITGTTTVPMDLDPSSPGQGVTADFAGSLATGLVSRQRRVFDQT